MLRKLSEEGWLKLYEKLAEALPEEAIQKAETKAFKGYNTTGYAYQFCVNRLNEVVGVDHWRVVHSTKLDEKGFDSSSTKMWEALTEMTIQLGDWENGVFIICAERSCWGGHMSKGKGDAFKGSYTNAFKKTISLFGVGRRAYEGLLDEDLFDPEGKIPEHTLGQAKGVSNPQPKTPPTKPPINQKPVEKEKVEPPQTTQLATPAIPKPQKTDEIPLPEEPKTEVEVKFEELMKTDPDKMVGRHLSVVVAEIKGLLKKSGFLGKKTTDNKLYEMELIKKVKPEATKYSDLDRKQLTSIYYLLKMVDGKADELVVPF